MSKEEARRIIAAVMNDPIPWYKQSSAVPSRASTTDSNSKEDIRHSLFALAQLKENLPDAKYSPVTWEEAQCIFPTLNPTPATDMPYSWKVVCVLLITKLTRTSGKGKANVFVADAKQLIELDPDSRETPCSLFFSAKDCPPTQVEMVDMEGQKNWLVADAGVVVEYQVSYWKKD